MNATTQIYRGIEDIVTPEFEKDEVVDKVINHLNAFNFEKDTLSDSELKKLNSCLPVLIPSQILSVSRHLKNISDTHHKNTYLNDLIQKSYNEEYNDFIIDSKKEWRLISHLIGNSKNRLKIRLLSNTEHDLGYKSSFCNIIAEQNVGSTGWEMQNCFVEIKKNLDYLSGTFNIRSTYTIHERLKEIDPLDNFLNVKLILNPEQYKKWKPKEKHYKSLKIELMEE